MNKEKYYLEYIFENTSHKSIWRSISNELGLESWFADKVELKGNTMHFYWTGSGSDEADIVEKEGDTRIRYQWREDQENNNQYFFEFNIYTMELSGEKVLEITDFAEPSERIEAIEFWDMLISKLRTSIGVSNR